MLTDDIQALLELIKNCYDADATWVDVNVESAGEPELAGSGAPGPGFVSIEDNGTGMTRAEFESGFLTISASQKKQMKAEGRTTARGRTPLGDKGLGRLGTQRLGDGIEIISKRSEDKSEAVYSFEWKAFREVAKLEDVPIGEIRRSSQREHGTKITITGLRGEAQTWADHAKEFQRALAEVLSPFRQVSREFVVAMTVDQRELDFYSLSDRTREAAQVTYIFAFDGKGIAIEGRAKIGLLEPQGQDKKDLFRQLVRDDGGKAFLSFLRKAPGSADFKFKRATEQAWFLAYSKRVEFADVAPALGADDQIVSPGAFSGEIDSFDLRDPAAVEKSAFDSRSEYAQFVKDLSGIRAYRDGFLVRTDRDWLGLSAAQTSGGSFYGLRPENTIGYVALSASDNGNLRENTAREGFINDAAYQNFYRLLREVTSFAGAAQEQLRRRYNEFVQAHLAEDAETKPDVASPEALTEQLESAVGKVGELDENAKALRESVNAAETSKGQAAARLDELGVNEEQRREALASLDALIHSARRLLDDLERMIGEAKSDVARAKLLQEQLKSLREQLTLSMETLSLGLTAEALSHEMFNLADRLSNETAHIEEQLNGDIRDVEVERYVGQVRGTMSGLRAELAHFSPSLRYVRQQREQIQLSRFVSDICAYYERRWSEAGISIIVRDKATFSVRMNRGKLTQVFDNLLLNSEHWLLEAIRLRRVQRPKVQIEIAGPVCRVWDNGPGVERTVENTLFEPFVTRKEQGRGRGLGLFIASQLLEAEGCSVSLRPERNSAKRRYKFEIDFAGALA